ncbi:MAG: nucleoside-diphosphate sugar epimerase/dehydratase [Clostridiaceae bacterium]
MITTTNYRKFILMIADIIVIAAGFFLAIVLQEEFLVTVKDLSDFKIYIPFFILIYLIAFVGLGMYKNMWAYASMIEYLNVMYANVGAFFGVIILDQAVRYSIRTSTIIIAAVFVFLGTEGIRVAYRVVMNKSKTAFNDKPENKTNTLIIGAGMAGKLLINEVIHNSNLNYVIKGLIDDNRSKLYQNISGVTVLGTTEDIPKLVEELDIDEVIFAIPSLSGEQKKRILNILNKTKVKMRTLPNISEIINKGIDISTIRDVEITDLLGRKEIELDLTLMNQYIEGKVVLISGGGGSIGSELCRQIAGFRPKQLIIFDIYENNAYDIQLELVHNFPQLDLVTLIGSVRDRKKVFEVFQLYKPNLVFHAAAHKHVPLMETSPKEAIKNNVFGTLNFVQAADEYETERFLLISTDKAVNPTNIMGATKRVCEMIIQTYNQISKHTCYVAVRFGNVLGSNGSVIPLFKRQIKEGGPVTVTHREITRYFMTIPEAVKLVLTAGSFASGGEIFVLDMGEPVKIYDLAKNLIRLSGYEPDVDIKIKVTGLRPGEKLYEELLMSEEGLTTTPNSLIFIGKPTDFNWETLMVSLNELIKTVFEDNTTDEEIKIQMKKIVQTYNYVSQDLSD